MQDLFIRLFYGDMVFQIHRPEAAGGAVVVLAVLLFLLP